MNKKVLNLLEYNKIIDLLSAQAGSELAREHISGFAPMSNMRMVKEALTETTEAVSVILYSGWRNWGYQRSTRYCTKGQIPLDEGASCYQSQPSWCKGS